MRAQQICVKSVLRTQQLYAKLNKNVIYQSFSIKTNTYRVTSERSDEIPASTPSTLRPTLEQNINHDYSPERLSNGMERAASA